MNQTNSQVDASAWLPPAVVMFIMRLLALVSLLMSLFLLFTHIAAKLSEIGVAVPFCSGLSWVDCESVLNSRYAVVFMIPVAAFAAALYLVILVILIRFNSKRSESAARRASWFFCASSAAIIISAAWFTYLQIVVLQRLCSYCMVEHIVGFVLALFMLIYGMVLCRPIRHAALPLGIIAAFTLIATQYFHTPRYIETVTWSDTDQRWIDGGIDTTTSASSPAATSSSIDVSASSPSATSSSTDASVSSPSATSSSLSTVTSTSLFNTTGVSSFLNGNILLRADLHPIIGLLQAKHFIIEVTDFTCPRCAIFANLFEQARGHLGPDYAVIVVFWPLNADCNSILAQYEVDDKSTGASSALLPNHSDSATDIYAHSCEFIRLAAAVWLVDRTAYSSFHRWLFENQGQIDPVAARSRAGRLVGFARLDAALNDSRLDVLLKRDLMLTKRLKIGHMPGIVVGSSRLSGIPEDPAELAKVIIEMINIDQ